MVGSYWLNLNSSCVIEVKLSRLSRNLHTDRLPFPNTKFLQNPVGNLHRIIIGVAELYDLAEELLYMFIDLGFVFAIAWRSLAKDHTAWVSDHDLFFDVFDPLIVF